MATKTKGLRSSAIKRSKGDLIFDIINYSILSLLVIVIMYPLYFIIIASFSDPTLVNSGNVLFIPKGINFDGYKRIFSFPEIWGGYKMTIIYTVLGTLFNLSLTMTLAYSLSRKRYIGKSFLTKFFMFTMYFSGGLIPTYLLVKDIGLYNNFFTLILLNGISIFNVIVAKSSIEGSIPEELFESASMDGCTHFGFFGKIVLPLSKPIIAVLVLYYGVGHWNNYLGPLIYVEKTELFPLQLILRNILIQGQLMLNDMMRQDDALRLQQETELIKYGLIIVSSVPLLIIYPFLQKYFAQGAMVGSVKG